MRMIGCKTSQVRIHQRNPLSFWDRKKKMMVQTDVFMEWKDQMYNNRDISAFTARHDNSYMCWVIT